MRKITLIVIVLLSQFSAADDVYMRTGSVLRNVKYIGIVKTADTYYQFEGVDRLRRIPVSNVITIDSSVAFDPTGKSFMETMSDSLKVVYELIEEPKTQPALIYRLSGSGKDSVDGPVIPESMIGVKKHYPNLIWLSVSAISAITSWEYFNAVGYYQSQIENNDNWNKYFSDIKSDIRISNESLKSAKTRATIIGVISSAAFSFSFVHAITPVEIKSDGQSLTLSYSF